MFRRIKFLLCFALMALAMSASAFIPERNPVSRQDAKAQSTGYEYNLMNRLTNVVNQGQWKASFVYDANGNILNHREHGGTEVSFAYDSMNRLVASTSSASSVISVVKNSYDLNGNRTNIVYPGGLTVGYSYDAENRLSGVSVSAPSAPLREFSFSYDGASRLTGMRYPNGVNSAFVSRRRKDTAPDQRSGFLFSSVCTSRASVPDGRGLHVQWRRESSASMPG